LSSSHPSLSPPQQIETQKYYSLVLSLNHLCN
jgi:hypothetical protein